MVVTVKPAAISYTIGTANHVYGSTANLAADLPATFNTGINGQNLSIAYSSAGNTTTTDVGTSPITGVVSNGTGGTAGLASDYTVNLTNGVLTINPATISYTIGNDSHAYGSTANLTADLPGTIATGVNGQNLSIAYSSAGNTTTTDVGTSPITGVVSKGTGGTAGLASDYTVNLTNGVLTINPATISYTIGNDSHAYGSTADLAADLPATFNTGINGQNLSIAYSSAGNTTTTDVGTSPITGVVSNGTGGTAGLASDYTVNLTNGVLTINPATISYTIRNGSHAYGSTANLAADLPATFNTGINGQNLSIAYSSTATRPRPMSARPPSPAWSPTARAARRAWRPTTR